MLSGMANRVSDPVAIAMNTVTRQNGTVRSGRTTLHTGTERRPGTSQSGNHRTDAGHLWSVDRCVCWRINGYFGDFDKDLVVSAVDEFTKDWKSDVPFERIPRVSVNNEVGDFTKVNTPDKANAAYFAAMTLPMKDSHPDYPALAIGNFALGSGGLLRGLADRVRQKDGGGRIPSSSTWHHRPLMNGLRFTFTRSQV